MINFSDLFDVYARKARLYPTLFMLFPLFVTVLILFPTVYETVGGGITSLAISCGMLMFLTSNVRYLGREKGKQLYKLWNGKPTTAWLRHRDTNLDPVTKSRYHTFLSAHVPQLIMPTSKEEKKNPEVADNCYESATKWLLEYTRDKKKFPRVFEENVNYGFYRNILAIKPIAVAINILCIIGILMNIYLQNHAITFIDAGCVVVLSILLLLWVFLVSPKWVKNVADAYARALLASCDTK